jgi:hypothetical protein
MSSTPRRSKRRPPRSASPTLSLAEIRRGARIARAFLPRGKAAKPLRQLSDRRVIVDVFLLIGAAAAKIARTPWNELMLRALSILLKDERGNAPIVRALAGWKAFFALPKKKREAIQREVARDLRHPA